jgi:hypothetical protein
MAESIKSKYKPSFPKKYKGDPSVEVVGKEGFVSGVI